SSRSPTIPSTSSRVTAALRRSPRLLRIRRARRTSRRAGRRGRRGSKNCKASWRRRVATRRSCTASTSKSSLARRSARRTVRHLDESSFRIAIPLTPDAGRGENAGFIGAPVSADGKGYRCPPPSRQSLGSEKDEFFSDMSRNCHLRRSSQIDRMQSFPVSLLRRNHADGANAGFPQGETHRRGRDRWVRKEHANQAAPQVAGLPGGPGVLHGVEFLGAGATGHQAGKEEEPPDAQYFQPPARHRLRGTAYLSHRPLPEGRHDGAGGPLHLHRLCPGHCPRRASPVGSRPLLLRRGARDRKSTRLNSSHVSISYAVFCLK